MWFIHSFIHFVFSHTTNLLPLPKWVLHKVQCGVSWVNIWYPLFSLRSSNSCLCLLTPLSISSVFPFNFPSIRCFRKQFLRKMWPIQVAFSFSLYAQYSFPPFSLATLLHFSHDQPNWSSSSSTITFRNVPGIMFYLPKCPSFSTIQAVLQI